MTDRWPATTPGLLRLPSGRGLVGRALRHRQLRPMVPDYGLCLSSREPLTKAVAFVRRNFHPRAVETRSQRRFVRVLAGPGSDGDAPMPS